MTYILAPKAQYAQNNLYKVVYTAGDDPEEKTVYIQAMGPYEIDESLKDTECPDKTLPRKIVSYEKIPSLLILSRMTLESALENAETERILNSTQNMTR